MSLILRHPQRTTSAAMGDFWKTQQQPTDLFDKPISLTSKNLSSDFRKTHSLPHSSKNHRFSVHPSFGDRCLFVGERTNSDLTDEQQVHTLSLRCHSTSFFSSSASCLRNRWQMASTRLDNWPLILPVSATRLAIWPQSSNKWGRDAKIKKHPLGCQVG